MVLRSIRLDDSPRPEGYPLAQLIATREMFEIHRRALIRMNPLEDREHMGLRSYVARRELALHEDLGCYHSPSESASKTERISAARRGTTPGYPDLVFHKPFEIAGVWFAGLNLEIKRAKFSFGGIPSLEQRIAKALSKGKRNKDAQHLLDQALWLERLRGWRRVAEFTRGACEGIALIEVCYGEFEGARWPVSRLALR